MANNMKQNIAYLMGIIILLADLYWIYTSYWSMIWLVLGIVILVADIVWLYVDMPSKK
jgi:hypothetical protein